MRSVSLTVGQNLARTYGSYLSRHQDGTVGKASHVAFALAGALARHTASETEVKRKLFSRNAGSIIRKSP